MGERAEDIVDGIVCDLCGSYFVREERQDEMYSHGYPATCHDCWAELSKSERKHHVRADDGIVTL